MKLIALCNFKNEEWILPIWLKRTSEFADEIIALDDGSTDNTYKLLKESSKVKTILSNPPNKDFNELQNRKRLLKEARKRNADWVIYLDADEIMDVRLKDKKDELMNAPNTVRYFFKEVTLWRSTTNFRTDKPELYNRIHKGFAVMAKVTPKLRWRYPYKHFIKHQINFFKTNYYFTRLLGQGSILLDERMTFSERLKFKIFGKIDYDKKYVELHDLMKLHYHFVDWNKVIKTHMFYALRHAYEIKARTNDFWKVVAYSTQRMDEKGMQTAKVKKEWGVLDL